MDTNDRKESKVNNDMWGRAAKKTAIESTLSVRRAQKQQNAGKLK